MQITVNFSMNFEGGFFEINIIGHCIFFIINTYIFRFEFYMTWFQHGFQIKLRKLCIFNIRN